MSVKERLTRLRLHPNALKFEDEGTSVPYEIDAVLSILPSQLSDVALPSALP